MQQSHLNIYRPPFLPDDVCARNLKLCSVNSLIIPPECNDGPGMRDSNAGSGSGCSKAHLNIYRPPSSLMTSVRKLCSVNPLIIPRECNDGPGMRDSNAGVSGV
ncbi:hypothetical protein CEXT_167711 [Caerostris extrusa]|uniref:Uncharacterized protein n=1 Tax=Caerostris extrusa TaxID=172846 RepID=A0AAV4PLZ8_CAEEX|nr:hypothetical protein CEXT_167711 [Caerostris extrusa]